MHRRNRLMPRGDGPFQVVERITDNAYKLDLLGEYGVHATFNVSDLQPYLAGDEFDLGTNRLQEEGNDSSSSRDRPMSSKELVVPRGPITRSRAKKLQEAMQALVRQVQVQDGGSSEAQGLIADDLKLCTLVQVIEAENKEA